MRAPEIVLCDFSEWLGSHKYRAGIHVLTSMRDLERDYLKAVNDPINNGQVKIYLYIQEEN